MNGVRVNSTRVVEANLQAGDEVAVADVAFTFRSGDARTKENDRPLEAAAAGRSPPRRRPLKQRRIPRAARRKSLMKGTRRARSATIRIVDKRTAAQRRQRIRAGLSTSERAAGFSPAGSRVLQNIDPKNVALIELNAVFPDEAPPAARPGTDSLRWCWSWFRMYSCDVVSPLVSRNGVQTFCTILSGLLSQLLRVPGVADKVGNPGLRYRTLSAFEHPPAAPGIFA